MKMDIPYDLLLLDVMLGGISGFRLATLLRVRIHKTAHIPIIFTTASGMKVPDGTQRPLKAGARLHL